MRCNYFIAWGALDKYRYAKSAWKFDNNILENYVTIILVFGVLHIERFYEI